MLLDPQTTHARIWLAFGTPAQSSRALTLLAAQAPSQTGDLSDLEQDIEKVRRDGYALDVSEERGVCAVGAPPREASNDLLACVSLVAPYRQSPAEAVGEWRRALLAATAALSAELGRS